MNNGREWAFLERDSTVLGTKEGYIDRNDCPVGVILNLSVAGQTDIGQYLRISGTLGDTLETCIGLINSEELLVGLKDGSAERDS